MLTGTQIYGVAVVRKCEGTLTGTIARIRAFDAIPLEDREVAVEWAIRFEPYFTNQSNNLPAPVLRIIRAETDYTC